MSIFGPSVTPPEWLADGRMYYSRVCRDRYDTVQVWIPPPDGEITAASRGTFQLQLQLESKALRVHGGDVGDEPGRIDTKLPKLAYTMTRGQNVVWKLTARSLVLRRHAVRFSAADDWIFHTPFYGWLNIVGLRNGAVKVVGIVGPTKRLWGFSVAPECDNPDMLSLMAFLHRNWLHS